MATEKLFDVLLDGDNKGVVIRKEVSGKVACLKGKDGKRYATFKGFINGRWYDVFLGLEEKETKDAKKYLNGKNKMFGTSLYDGEDGKSHFVLYKEKYTAKKSTRKSVYPKNTGYGKSNFRRSY
jgi:hypothetical protein